MTENNVAAAVAAAWPGSSVLARIRRRIALELATLRDGPFGPHTCLGAALSSALRAKCLGLVTEASQLCYPPNGKIRFNQLLAHGPGFFTSQSGQPPPEDMLGGAFLYCKNHTFDVCLVLDLPALLKWHAGGSPMGPRTPSDNGTTAGGRSGVVVGGGGGRNARLLLSAPGEAGSATGFEDLRSYNSRALHQPEQYRASYATPADGEPLTAAGEAPPLLELDFEDLGLRAFPGPTAANQLRRLLVQRLGAAGADGQDGLPPYAVPWRLLVPLVAGSRAATLCPGLTTAATFRAFCLHAASAGVFATIRVVPNAKQQLPSSSSSNNNNNNNNSNNSMNENGSSNSNNINNANNNGEGGSSSATIPAGGAAATVDCVALNVPALRRAASSGICSAFAAVWPGNGPLPRLKRAAARVLSAVRGSYVGPYTLNSGPMGNALAKCDELAYSMIRGTTGGLMSRLDESAWNGYLQYVRLEGKEGCLRLKLHTLLLEFPAVDGRDLGLGSELPGASGATGPVAQTQPAVRPQPTSNVGVPANGVASELRVMVPRDAATASAGPPTAGDEGLGDDGRGRADPWATSSTQAGLPVPVPVPVPAALRSGALPAAGAGGGRPMQQNTHAGAAAVDPSVRWATAEVAFPLPCRAASTSAGVTATNDGNGGSSISHVPPQEVANSMLQASNGPSQQTLLQEVSTSVSPAASAPAQSVGPEILLIWIHTAHEYEAMTQHCTNAGQIGLAVHGGRTAGCRPEVAAVYAPAAAPATSDESYCTADDTTTGSWPAAVYLFDCAMLSAAADASGVGADGACPDAAAAMMMLRGLLENPYVVKAAHGGEQAASLAACCNASTVAPLLDTRVLLTALTSMLPPLPQPPAPQAAGGALAAVGPLVAAARAKLNAHAGALSNALAATGLWSERPELLAGLVGRHAAALREEVFGLQAWASNPAAHQAALVAAAMQLPELWEALTHEAIPWVAMAAAATAVESALSAAQRQRTPSGGSSDTSTPTPTPGTGTGTGGNDSASTAVMATGHQAAAVTGFMPASVYMVPSGITT